MLSVLTWKLAPILTRSPLDQATVLSYQAISRLNSESCCRVARACFRLCFCPRCSFVYKLYMARPVIEYLLIEFLKLTSQSFELSLQPVVCNTLFPSSISPQTDIHSPSGPSLRGIAVVTLLPSQESATNVHELPRDWMSKQPHSSNSVLPANTSHFTAIPARLR